MNTWILAVLAVMGFIILGMFLTFLLFNYPEVFFGGWLLIAFILCVRIAKFMIDGSIPNCGF